MKLLLTSAGISNKRIYNALVDLLGKPISASNALFVPTAIYAVSGGTKIVIPLPSHAIDDQTAIVVVNDNGEVISEGNWTLFHGA